VTRSAIETAELVRSGRASAVEVLEEARRRIEAANPELNAFVHLDFDLAHEQAALVDARRARGEDPGPFAGVPMGVKDLEDCAGMPTSHGSRLFVGRGPVGEDSVHVSRLRAAGAVFVGKTAAPEFGTVCYTSTPAFGTTRNPWDLSRTPGGSSGGSAAAVAAGLVPACTASDGGGSTRIPAAFCGLVGMKPSYGRIPHPRAGVSETSVYGMLCTTVADAARHLDVTSGPDDRDRCSLPPPAVRYEEAIESLDVRGLRAAWSLDQGFAVVDPEVGGIAHEAAMALVREAGLELVDRPLVLDDALAVWWGNGAVDAWLNLEPGMWPERKDELMGINRAALERGEGYTVARYARQRRRRWAFEEKVAAFFRDVDVLLCPTTAVAAFAAEGPMPMVIDGRDAPSGPTPLTMLANMCWNPAVSIPAGFTSEGLPVGLQVVARRHADEVCLRLARIFELARPWPRVAPRPSR
jgi:aspartyl-tRNA(Asn)/glutamyl-tRNA(Gln) amidotransferase subunit A